MEKSVSQLAIFGAISNYWVISISIVFVNKILMSGENKVDAPIFITWYQCVCTVFACWAMGTLGLAGVPRYEVRPEVLKQVLPLSVVFLLMILTNNLCLKYVEVSFYQIARSLTLVFNVILTYYFLGESTSPKALATCGVVLFGFLLGNQQEVNWNLLGVVFGVASSLFVALNSIYVKKVLPIVDNNSWKLTLYNNVNASVLFVPFILLSGEIPILLESPVVRTTSFWAMMTLAGVLGVAIGLATAYQIQMTSPLTHNISGTAKAAAQTVMALYIYQNPITGWGAFSIGLVLAGSMAYTMVRRNEMMAKQNAPRPDIAYSELKNVDTKCVHTTR